MRDFSPLAYRRLLEAASRRYRIVTISECCANRSLTGIVALRHDVDRRPVLASRCAEIAAEVGVRGTFYFRYPYTFQPRIIDEVTRAGHEVGYHYEVLSKSRGDVEQALSLFRKELAAFREVTEVTSACMHGAPLRKWHNLDIWAQADPADFGLIGEPYLDIDWDVTFYLTDTGRGWNVPGVAIRDVVGGRGRRSFGSTVDLIEALEGGELPDRVAITIHPERWVDSAIVAGWDAVLQGMKNAMKEALIRRGSRAR